MILIDTHIWIWAVEGFDRLTRAQSDALAAQDHAVWLSSISLWETAMLIQRGQIETTLDPRDWIDKALTMDRLNIVELTPPIVCQSMNLPKLFHKDPADRIIAATSLVLGCPLVTSDQQLIRHASIQTIG